MKHNTRAMAPFKRKKSIVVYLCIVSLSCAHFPLSNQAGLISYAILDLEQDLGLPIVQLAQLIKLDNTSCELVHIAVIHSSENAL
jgi:hypothetical protein